MGIKHILRWGDKKTLETSYGKLLFKQKKTPSLVYVLYILILLIFVLIGLVAASIFGKIIFLGFAAWLVYYLQTKGKGFIAIYENALIVQGHKLKLAIKRDEIKHIAFQTLKVNAFLFFNLTNHHYPVLTVVQDKVPKIIKLDFPLNKKMTPKYLKAFETFLKTELILD
jgi:hypothetical protein